MTKATYSPKAPKGSRERRLWKQVWDDYHENPPPPPKCRWVRDPTLEFDEWGHPIEKS